MYLAGDHGVSHTGWVVLHLVGCGDEVDVCLDDDGGTRLSFGLGKP